VYESHHLVCLLLVQRSCKILLQNNDSVWCRARVAPCESSNDIDSC